MKARVKETGEIIEVRAEYDLQGEMPQVFYSNEEDPYEFYEKEELDFNVNDNISPTIDYWEKLKHQYAGMAMNALLLTNNIKNGDLEGMRECNTNAMAIAHALIEKFKEE